MKGRDSVAKLGSVLTPEVIGALLMIGSMASFTFNDMLVKLTDGALPLWQLLFLRGLLTSVLVAVLGFRLNSIHFRIDRRDWGFIGLRCAAETGVAYFFITALLVLPLANVSAILQMLPLTVTLAAMLFLGEPVGWRRMAAIGIGFCGMLLIVQPGADRFNLMSVYALLAVACITLRDIVTRKMSEDVPSMTVTLAAAVAVMAFAGVASVPQGWAPVTPWLGMLIAGASVTIIGGYYFSIQVMRHGDVSFTAPFRYSSLIFALFLGWFVFGDWPDAMTLLGAGIIVATGLFTLWRERAVSGG